MISYKISRLIFFIFCAILILYPNNIRELFYYDDNPIRYMIAKMWVDGRFDKDEKITFLAYGSGEIYIPFFQIAKLTNTSYELVYNLTSLFLFILSLIYIFLFMSNEKEKLHFIMPLFVLFGVVSVAKGSIHWFIASSIFLHITYSKSIRLIQYILLGISYIIAPPLIVSSAIISFVLWIKGERRKQLVFIVPLIFLLLKIIAVYPVNIESAKRSFDLENNFGRDITNWATRSFSPPDFDILFRPIFVDYFKNSTIPAIISYTIVLRAIFTKDKIAIFCFFSFYVLVVFSILLLRVWLEGYNIPDYLISIFSFFFESNPFRYIPLFTSYLLINSDKKKYDRYLSALIMILLFLYSLVSFAKKEGELPTNFPPEVKELIEFLKNSDSKNILVEGDTHIIQDGKLIHPLYNSHIISYIVAETENKNFYGGIVPWNFNRYNFFAGKFNNKNLENSDISEFIEEKNIDTVICWTENCSKFFGSETINFGKLKVIRVK